MSVQLYKNKLKSHIVYCFINDLDRYTSNWIKEIIKNSADFELTSVLSRGHDVIISDNADHALLEACKKHTHAVVCSLGNQWFDQDTFFKLVNDKCQENFFIIGDIVDNELDTTCYLIDLDCYRRLNYTIKGNEGDIEPFDDEFKKYKRYFHPDKCNSLKMLGQLYLESSIGSKSWTSAFQMHRCNTHLDMAGPLLNFVTNANGLDWILYLYHYGFDENTRVKFVDYNMASLEFTRQLVQWEGEDYPEFMYNFGKEKTEYLNLPYNSFFSEKDNIEQLWSETKKMVNWDETWPKIRKMVKFEFCYKDFLHQEIDHWLDESYNTEKTLINISHVFSYYPSAIFYTLDYRISMENATIRYLKENVPEAFIKFTGRAGEGLYEEEMRSFGQCKELVEIQTTELIRPAWHDPSDWL